MSTVRPCFTDEDILAILPSAPRYEITYVLRADVAQRLGCSRADIPPYRLRSALKRLVAAGKIATRVSKYAPHHEWGRA